MSEIASSFVSLVPSARGFGRKLDSEISGDIARSGKKSGSTWGKIFAIGAGLAIGAKAVRFLGDSLAEARESVVVGKRTTNVIKSMGGVANITAKQVSDLATAISLKTGIDDEAIQSGQNLLLTFGNIRNEAGKGNDIFSQTTQLMVDMSAAMGKDAKGSAIQLGKALNDPVKGVTALTRVGVAFTAQQVEQIKKLQESSNILGAQKLIMREVKREFGGAAAAMASPADKARTAFANLQEQIGLALLPQVDRFLTFLTNKVIPGVSDFARKVKRFFKGVVASVQDFFDSTTGHAAVATSFGLIGDAAGAIKRGLSSAATDAKRIGRHLGKIDFGNLDGKQLGTQLGKAIRIALTSLASLTGTITKTLGQMFAKVDWIGLGISIGKQVPALLIGLATGIVTFDPATLLKGIGDHWREILLAIFLVAFSPAKLVGPLAKILTRIPFVGVFLSRALLWLNELGGKLATFGGDLLSSMWRGLTAGKTPGAAIVAKVIGGFKAIPGAVKGFFDLLRIRLGVYGLEGAEAIGSGIRTGTIAVLKFVAGIPGKILSALGSLARFLFPKGTALIEGMADGLKQRIVGFLSYVGDIPGKIRSALGNLSVLLFEAGKNIVLGLINGIRAMAGKAAAAAIQVVKDALNAAKGFLKIGSPSKKWQEVGEQAVEGFVVGLRSKAAEEKAKKALQSLIDKLKGKLSSLKSDMASLASSVASAFTSDVFGGTTNDLLRGLGSDVGNLKAVSEAFKKLIKMGASKQFLSALFQSGNTALILDLANSPGLLDTAVDLFGQRTDLAASLGAAVGQNQFGDKIDGVREEIKALRKDVQANADRTARLFAGALSGTAADAKRNGRLSAA